MFFFFKQKTADELRISDWSSDVCSSDREEMTAALGALKPPPGIKLMQSWHPNDGNCCWQMAAVDPFGRSIGCSYLREFVDYGDVREDGKIGRASCRESVCRHV